LRLSMKNVKSFPMLVSVPKTLDEAIEVIQRLAKELEKLGQENETLKQENEALRNELAKLKGGEPPDLDPSTPSGMIPAYQKENKGNRNRGRCKKPGRKDGHEGCRRAVPAVIHRTMEHTLDNCPECGTTLRDKKPSRRRIRYIEDIVKGGVEATEHVIYGSYCPKCKKVVEAKVNEALPNCTLGLYLIIMTAWLHYGLGVTIGNVVKWLNRICQIEVSSGGLFQAWYRIAEILKPFYEQIKEEARSSAVLHGDETGWRVNGKTFWLWCFAAKNLVFYVIKPSRASPVVKEVLGEIFKGVLICDFFGAYNAIVAWAKQRCITHLLRELKKISEHNYGGIWVDFYRKLRRVLKDALKLRELKEGLDKEQYQRRIRKLYDRLDELMYCNYNDKDVMRIVKRLRRHRSELFTFLEHCGVDASNNHAERMLRPPVTSRKNSYCNRSERGAEVQAIMMSIFKTLELRGIDPVRYLEESIRNQISTGILLPLAA